MTDLKDLKSGKLKTSEKKAGEKKTSEKKADKVKKTPDELKALRLKNLKIRKKSPEKEAEDKAITEAALKILAENPKGVQIKELRGQIFESTDETEFAKLEKRLRYLLRAAGCPRNQLEGTKRKVYLSPLPETAK